MFENLHCHGSGGTSSTQAPAASLDDSDKEDKPLLDAPFAGKGGQISTGLGVLFKRFGWRFLAMLFCTQHLTQGFTHDFLGSAHKYVFREYDTPAPRMAVYAGIVELPYALKPVIGALADFCPICGYTKIPYLLGSTLVGLGALLALATAQHDGLGVNSVVGLLFLVTLFMSCVDLLTEATYAKELRAQPALGPALLSYIWAGANVMSIVAAIAAGPLLLHYTPWYIYRVAMVPAALVLLPTLLNWVQDRRLSDEEVEKQRQKVWEQREAVVLSLVMLFATLSLSVAGLRLPTRQATAATVLVSLIVLFSFSVILNPTVAKVNAFGLIQSMLQPSLSSASFYFMLDNKLEYPDGPHFSIQFYSVILPIAGNVLSCIGIWFYNRHAGSWTYQKTYIIGNLIACGCSFMDVLFYLQVNRRMGISDQIFAFGNASMWDAMKEWLWMPSAVLMSHMCPPGMEAIMYANLAGCHYLGRIASTNFGAQILESLQVEPSGAYNEMHQFDNLWLGALLSAFLPLASACLVPAFIPPKLSTESIFDDVELISATDGSYLRRWLHLDTAEDATMNRGPQAPAAALVQAQ